MRAECDVLIFGGGAAGLWLLDVLAERGVSALLLEAGDLGRGQTSGSQGIIHGGLKYTLQGLLTPSASSIREMPGVWRDCLAGRRCPDLSVVQLRSSCCYLWRTDTFASRIGMIGAKFGLRVAPQSIGRSERPAALRHCPGDVARLEEQVISPASFLSTLADRHASRLLQIDADHGLRFSTATGGFVTAVHLRMPRTQGAALGTLGAEGLSTEEGASPGGTVSPLTPAPLPRKAGGEEFVSTQGAALGALGAEASDFPSEELTIRPRHVVFAAGAGNSDLRRRVGLSASAMQRRPLHMALVRGDLPVLNGHCVDGAKTRVTITSDVDATGRTVWQVGGQIAEEGVEQDRTTLIEACRTELESVLPGLDLSQAEFATYRVDRAEGATAGGKRPDTFQILEEGNVITAWPTKLVLAPLLAEAVAKRLADLVPTLRVGTQVFDAPRRVSAAPRSVADVRDDAERRHECGAIPAGWPRPCVAQPPWETCGEWIALPGRGRRAA